MRRPNFLAPSPAIAAEGLDMRAGSTTETIPVWTSHADHEASSLGSCVSSQARSTWSRQSRSRSATPDRIVVRGQFAPDGGLSPRRRRHSEATKCSGSFLPACVFLRSSSESYARTPRSSLSNNGKLDKIVAALEYEAEYEAGSGADTYPERSWQSVCSGSSASWSRLSLNREPQEQREAFPNWNKEQCLLLGGLERVAGEPLSSRVLDQPLSAARSGSPQGATYGRASRGTSGFAAARASCTTKASLDAYLTGGSPARPRSSHKGNGGLLLPGSVVEVPSSTPGTGERAKVLMVDHLEGTYKVRTESGMLHTISAKLVRPLESSL